MSDKFSQHDPFYTGPLWGNNPNHVKVTEKYWAGGTGPSCCAGGSGDGSSLSSIDFEREEVDLFVFNFPLSSLPATFDTTFAKTILVENKDDDFHVVIDDCGIEPLERFQIDADVDILTDKTYTINAVDPIVLSDGETFNYEGAPVLGASVLSASDAVVTVKVQAKNATT